ncbi:NERD domain-containing protein [Alkalihalobacillus sp. MEB130]|uniref:nuclease-related domain-containing protein n=1 Tax=Alkalihalobacillus sp. MEB130 TaxID=2976704 RepID=UPI0028DDB8E8|nr:nuclease-related domain-containing protein [Alkalihalobacillus sp. MEB130]MDT8858889.1 NERD domain-containing protein [Alkalihalobacillus sp. MEB130]
MMKQRSESLELLMLRSLYARMDLGAQTEQYYMNLEKGYEGELIFDEWMKPLFDGGRIFLNDLLLECNNTLFQIDSFMLTSTTLYLFEIKNYEGDFIIEEERWYSAAKKEMKNPLLQLRRNESLLRQLLQEHRITYPIESYLVFVHPEFTLYQAPLNLPIIHPNQLKRFITKLNKKPTKLKDTHSKLAEKLLSLHLPESPYTRLPEYNYASLQKGIPCPHCQTFYTSFASRKTFLCTSCGWTENIIAAVLRNIEEFTRLFPDKKITTETIYDWCNEICSKKVIWTVLSKNYKYMGHGRSAYYVNHD